MPQQPSRVVGLFATPVMHTAAAVGRATVERLRRRLADEAVTANRQSTRLTHTAPVDPQADGDIAQLAEQILPPLQAFGELLFGEPLPWLIKEAWGNVLWPGGHQALHNHANSLVSGVVYLSAVPSSSRTVFVRALGQPGYIFSNQHAGVGTGPFNGDKWVTPEVAPGDLMLFPSHLLHEVPAHDGEVRISLAFNAVPRRLDAWGYTVGFTR
jgi:uncharacterized protein (TIGR02466 family)